MKKLVGIKKKFHLNRYDILASALLLGAIAFLVFCFSHVFFRTVEAAKNFGLAVTG